MKKMQRLAAVVTLAAGIAQATVYTWTGGANTDWNNEDNWSPAGATFNNTNDFVIAGTVNLDQYIRVAKTVRSLTFSDSNTGTTAIGLRAFNGADRDLTFSALSGNASLTVDALADGDKIFGNDLTTTNLTDGEVVLVSNLDISHNGASNLVFDCEIRGPGDLSLAGTGTTVLSSGLNSYIGSTTVSADSTLNLLDDARLTFAIGEHGVNNSLSGSGTVNLDGDFVINLTGASTFAGSEWQIIDVDSLSETFGATFTVSSTETNFTDNAGVWTVNRNGTDYEFSQATGMLKVLNDEFSFQVVPTELAMDLPATDNQVTGLVDVVYNSTTNMDIIITISDETHPGSFSVLSDTPQTLTNVSPSVNSLYFEFDKTVQNVDGETSTGLVTIAWSETGGGESGTVLLPISVDVDSVFEVTPSELVMEDLEPTDTVVTGSVDAVYYTSADMDISITISGESHPGSFSVLSATPQTLTNAYPALNTLYFEFDRTVHNVVGETSTGLVTIAWAENGGGVSGTFELPISARVKAEKPDPDVLIAAAMTDWVRGGNQGNTAQDGSQEIVVKKLANSGTSRFGMLRFALTDEQKAELLAASDVTLEMYLKAGNTQGDTTIRVVGLADGADAGAGTSETTWDTSVTWNSRPDGDSALENALTTHLGDTLIVQNTVNTLVSLTLDKTLLDALIVADTNNEITLMLGDTASESSNFFASLTNTGGLPVPALGLVTGATGYAAWITNFGLSGDDLLPETDVEPDGLDNLMEYALGGNPTNDDAAAVSPETYSLNDGSTDWFYHVSNQRDGDATLSFTLGSRTSLSVPSAWATNDVYFVGESVASNDYKTVTNRTEMTTDAKFIQMEVEQSEAE